MPFLFRKIFSLLTVLRHPSIPKHLRHYQRNNYYARFLQIKHLADDYITKKPYKVTDFNGEFSQEIMWVLPFAYWHHKNGTLKKTISPKGMSVFYFFSAVHEEPYQSRDWQTNENKFDVPNMAHCKTVSYKKWMPVPLKAHYQNNLFQFSKPVLIVANKYNVEWDGPPLNFFSKEQLSVIFDRFGSDYQLVYNRPPAKQIVGDNSEILDLHEHQWIEENYPDVILLDKLYERYAGEVTNFNHFQLLLYANASRFISVHGGTSVLASYFGGKNLIYSKKGIEHDLNEFHNFYPKLSGAEIEVARTENELLEKLDFISV